jgi:hypothetical protein
MDAAAKAGASGLIQREPETGDGFGRCVATFPVYRLAIFCRRAGEVQEALRA